MLCLKIFHNPLSVFFLSIFFISIQPLRGGGERIRFRRRSQWPYVFRIEPNMRFTLMNDINNTHTYVREGLVFLLFLPLTLRFCVSHTGWSFRRQPLKLISFLNSFLLCYSFWVQVQFSKANLIWNFVFRFVWFFDRRRSKKVLKYSLNPIWSILRIAIRQY